MPISVSTATISGMAHVAPPSSPILHERLTGGMEFLAEAMPEYHTTTLMLRVGGGMAVEPEDRLGLAYITEQTLNKGTARHDARGFADALDAIGASLDIYTGRQSWTFVLSSLPEFLPATIHLAGEVIRTATFPAPAVETALSLAEQELKSLEDYPRGLLRRRMVAQAYGPVLGRHNLGSFETLARIKPADVADFWQKKSRSGPLTAVVAGRFDLPAVRAALVEAFGGLSASSTGATESPASFTAIRSHIQKELEQQYMGISFPGVTYDHPEYTIERVLLAVLSGGMSGRLFVEVREKQGLVYWVGAWHEQPRGLGMIHVGAATTPQRCQQTYETLLREIARLQDDLTEEELARAKVGLLADNVTTGAAPDRRASDILTDHFHLGRAQTTQVKNEAIQRVSVADIRQYLAKHPRDRLSIVTLGPKELL